MSLTALVDGDVLVYVHGFAIESTYYEVADGSVHSTPGKAKKYIKQVGLSDDTLLMHVEHEPLANALHLIKNCLKKIENRTGCTDMRIFLTGEGNFREEIATIKPYKGNRPSRKPLYYKEIRDYLVDIKGAEVVQGIEADDAMGVFAGGNTVICTIDKDLDMVEGMHYNFRTDALYDVSEFSALRNFYMQLLTGDTVDNIRGVPGVGKMTARKLIYPCADEEEMYWTCLNEYCRTHDKAYEALLENARLLWILRNRDSVEGNWMWNPPV